MLSVLGFGKTSMWYTIIDISITVDLESNSYQEQPIHKIAKEANFLQVEPWKMAYSPMN